MRSIGGFRPRLALYGSGSREQSGLAVPPPDPEWLARWKRAARWPLWDDEGGNDGIWLAAIATGAPLTVLYDKPGAASERRRITASLLFEVDGYESTYLEAWDHDKQAWRHFNTDRLAPLLDRTGRRLEEIADERRRAAEGGVSGSAGLPSFTFRQKFANRMIHQ